MKKRSLEDHPLVWAVEELLGDPGLVLRPMFGCLALYIRGRLCLVLASKEEPWKGILVPTSREHHKALIKKIPGLSAHPVLGKWLYLPEDSEGFEEDAARLVKLVRMEDPLIGIEPKAPSARKNPKPKTSGRKDRRPRK